MKVSELEGAQLDYWVGKTDGQLVFLHDCISGRACSIFDETVWTHTRNYSPSTDWKIAGPIIERMKFFWFSWCDDEIATGYIVHLKEGISQFGPTPLIAAMRCYVASKFGEDVPDESA